MHFKHFSEKTGKGFSLLEIMVGLVILFLALTPLFTTIMSQKDFGTLTLKEIQATCYADEIISQLYVYPNKFLKPGVYNNASLTKAGAALNEVYAAAIFGAPAPDLYITAMEAGFERNIEIVYDAVLKLFKVKVTISYDTVSLTGKAYRGVLNNNAIISDFQ